MLFARVVLVCLNISTFESFFERFSRISLVIDRDDTPFDAAAAALFTFVFDVVCMRERTKIPNVHVEQQH